MDNNKIAQEIAKCAMDFKYFLTYCRISETPSLETKGGLIPFEMWADVKDAIDTFLSNRLIVWLKSRQIGASWIVAAYCLWYALFKNGATILLLSAGESEAIVLLSKCRSIHDALPIWLQSKMSSDSRTEMNFIATDGFTTMKSVIRALPSTEKAGVGNTASIIVCDEWDLHEYAIENFMQIKPCIDSSGGQFIGIFTRDPMGGESLAVNTFRAAMEGRNGFKPLFHPYWVRPGRDEAWYEKTRRELTQEVLKGMTPELYMMKAYPRSIEEALSVSGIISVFDPDVLTSMLNDCRNPIKTEGIDNNIVHIYKPFSLGEYYVSSCDISHGVGKDYSVGGIMNVRTGEVVADIMHNSLSVEEFTEHYFNMLKLYREPIAYPEDNDWGHMVCLELERMNYKNLGYQDEKKTKPGFHTGKNRTGIFLQLTPAINNRQIIVYNKEGVKQLFDLVRNPGKEGRIEARSGGHDDYAMMLAICWAKKDTAIVNKFQTRTIESLHFRGRNKLGRMLAL